MIAAFCHYVLLSCITSVTCWAINKLQPVSIKCVNMCTYRVCHKLSRVSCSLETFQETPARCTCLAQSFYITGMFTTSFTYHCGRSCLNRSYCVSGLQSFVCTSKYCFSPHMASHWYEYSITLAFEETTGTKERNSISVNMKDTLGGTFVVIGWQILSALEILWFIVSFRREVSHESSDEVLWVYIWWHIVRTAA